MKLLAPVCLVLAFGCAPGPHKSYRAHRADDPIDVDGVLDESVWAEALRESELSFPWQEREAPATEFRALSGDRHLYFAFIVHDADIVIDEGVDEEAVARGDRVELFFAPNLSLDDYVCFEIDPRGRVLDYRASYYREFDSDWDLPELVVASVVSDTGYVIEGSIPLAALPGPDEDGHVLTGIFRAELSHRDGDEPLAEWISWVIPDSEEPDFHIPSAFGWLDPR